MILNYPSLAIIGFLTVPAAAAPDGPRAGKWTRMILILARVPAPGPSVAVPAPRAAARQDHARAPGRRSAGTRRPMH